MPTHAPPATPRGLPCALLSALCLSLLLVGCATLPGEPKPPAGAQPVSAPPRIEWPPLAEALAAELNALPGIQVKRTPEHQLQLTIPAAEGFPAGSAEARPELLAAFDRLVPALKRQPLAAIHVIGHTDSTGSEVFNQRLSIDRAEAVVEHLRRRGLPLLRLFADGHGEAEPVADNDTPEGRALNRRIEIHIRPLR